MIEYASIPTIAYTVSGLVYNTKRVPGEIIPFIALFTGIVAGIAIAMAKGDNLGMGFMMGLTGLTATGFHEAFKMVKPKVDNHELESIGNEVPNQQSVYPRS